MTHRRHGLGLLLCGVASLAVGKPAEAVEVGYGAALRQTAALYNGHEDIPFVPGGISGAYDLRMRPNLDLRFGYGSLRLEPEVVAGFTSASGVGTTLLGSPDPLRLIDKSWRPIHGSGGNLRGDIERLDYQVTIGPIDLDLGRQPIGLGTSHFIGVLDVVTAFSPGDLDASFRPGVDAVRLRTGIGAAGEAELIAVGADPIERFAALGRARFMVGAFDLEVVAGRFRERLFGGVGWEGEAGPLALWGEVGLFEHRAETVWAGWEKAAVMTVAGFELRPHEKLLVGSALFYQDFGVRNPDDYLRLMTEPMLGISTPQSEGWAYLSGAGYGLVTVNWEAHPLVNIGAAGFVNLIDGSNLWQPRVDINVSDEADLALFGWISAGASPGAANGLPVLKSELAAFPDGGGVYARWFF